MARIRGTVRPTDVNYSKFLGLYEAADGDTQMKNGVSPKMENFQITESFHLKTRPGIVPYKTVQLNFNSSNRCRGYYSNETLEIAIFNKNVYTRNRSDTGNDWASIGEVSFPLDKATANGGRTNATIFAFDEWYYILTGGGYYRWKPGETAVTPVVGYVPLIVTGAAPSGGGTSLERINLLTNKRRVQYSADGTSKDFVLPEVIDYASGDTVVLAVTVDGSAVTWTEDVSGLNGICTVTLAAAPAKGVNNVEITYQNPQVDDSGLIKNCRYYEKFNGATDTRLFLYRGDSNILYYSEPTLSGEVTGAYFPSLNEIKVGDSSSPVTGLQRHYGRMMAFKTDSCYAISYDAITLPDGTLTAGFYVRTMHREIGSDLRGQVCVVQNFPRTLHNDSLYDWKQTASYYQDERYARLVSQPVQFSLSGAHGNRFIYDDEFQHRFYCFLNDDAGTVLVNAYEQGVWFKYTGFYNVTAAGRGRDGKLLFAMERNGSAGLFALSDAHSHDYIPKYTEEGAEDGCTKEPIVCTWESGYMDFGRSNTRKYSSYIWATLQAGRQARAWLSARSDRRPSYAEKNAENSITGLFDETDFADFTFETYEVPRVRRLKIKVKKFVDYKLLVRCENGETISVPSVPSSSDGAVTVLSIDQRVRFASDAK